MTTEIASAGDSVADGDFRLVRPSSVTPAAQLAEDRDDPADLVVGRRQRRAARSARPSAATRWPTMATSSSAVAGSGRTPC